MNFDKTRIKSLSEKSQLGGREFRVKQIIPLIQVDGILYLTSKRVYFQPVHTGIYGSGNTVVNFKIKEIIELFKRRYKLLNIGLEFRMRDQQSTMYLAFQNTEERDSFYAAIKDLVSESCVTAESSILDYTQQWVNGALSNLDYLLLLNSYAQRSFQDLTQYPVFPWVLQDFKSEVLDLKDPKVYRDLSKPIGALNEDRLKGFIKRYNETPEEQKYLYGTHYSCPGYVIGFLVRQYPQWMIKFQGGKFDNPNRLFKGINKEWKSVNTNPGNVKELIPEFYLENPEFLLNK
jgi:factor associated with neutral sphingomyelinase activation